MREGEGESGMGMGMGGAVSVVIEVPRGSFLKRELAEDGRGGRGRGRGRIEYVSPLPCPFHYGSIEGTRGADGDALDAVVLGGGAARAGERRAGRVIGVVRFVDAGVCDDKYVVRADGEGAVGGTGAAGATVWERRLVEGFFGVYGPIRYAMNRARGMRGETGYRGAEWGEERGAAGGR